jgi:hypothetical protein
VTQTVTVSPELTQENPGGGGSGEG